MKDIFESPETFDAYARIDYGYFLLGKLNESRKHLSPIEKMVDQAAGYDNEKELAKQARRVVEDILAAKKEIEAPCHKEENLLEHLDKIISA